MSELEKFLEERSKIPIPNGDTAWVKLLAQELALGVLRELWDRQVNHNDHVNIALTMFLVKRWSTFYESRKWGGLREALRAFGYYEEFSHIDAGKLTQAAFDLLLTAPSFNVFVSYTHRESSAFALLLVTKLPHYGIQPFCDMSLLPGEDWHPELEKQIKKCEHLIVLVGRETRNSGPTIKEIQWAIANDKIVIPIWHNGFEFKNEEWAAIDDDVVNAIQRKHAVIVQNESAAGYNAAVAELLSNRFGIMP